MEQKQASIPKRAGMARLNQRSQSLRASNFDVTKDLNLRAERKRERELMTMSSEDGIEPVLRKVKASFICSTGTLFLYLF